MNRDKIISAISKWNEIRFDAEKVIKQLEDGNCFFFSPSDYDDESQYIHAYPGIHDQWLTFFLIPAKYDTAEYRETFNQYVTVCPTMWNLSSGRIPDFIARERMHRWNTHYKAWAKIQVDETTDGIFQVFLIDREDFEVQECQVNMALREDYDNPLGHAIADMIVTNKTDTEVFYDDFSKAVPPYGPAAVVNDFFLLELALFSE
jgi:hypothetical protein